MTTSRSCAELTTLTVDVSDSTLWTVNVVSQTEPQHAVAGIQAQLACRRRRRRVNKDNTGEQQCDERVLMKRQYNIRRRYVIYA